MSSDVYIDVEDDTIRLGHLGTLVYFQRNLYDWVDFLRGAFPIINDLVIEAVPAAIRYFNESNAQLVKSTTPEYRRCLYGYYDPDWTDVLDPEDARDFLTKHTGKPWTTRHD